MREHSLETETFLPYPRQTVFGFFSDPRNLAKLTPTNVGFEILPPAPSQVAEGSVIEYRIRLYGFPMRWRSRIVGWDPPREFSDDQLRGPYRLWVHRHVFEERDGGTLIRDHVRYRLKFYPFGEVAGGFVKAELKRIFAFRQSAMERLFPAPGLGKT